MAQTVAEILVDQMVEAGIRKVYGIVGDSANPIVDALRRHEADIEFVHVRNEEAGAFAAGADAQISGRPTAVLGSSGPGSLHLVNGLYDCQRNAAPVFAIATHIPSTEIGSDYFQETNPEAIFSGCTNYCALISTAGQMPRVSELALQAAILERGVGMIILPGDIAAQTVDHPMLRHPVLTDRPVIRPDDDALAKAVALIAGAEKIAIHGGEGTRNARAEVLRLSETLQAPISFAYRGKDVLEADNPSAVGMTGLLGWGGATEALADCDLLLMLGTDFPYHAFLPDGKTIIQVDDKPLHLGRRAAVDLGLVGDVGETLRALIPHAPGALATRTFLDKIVKHHHTMVEGHPDLRHPRGQRPGAATRDGGDRAERPRRGRRRVHRRHRDVQRLGRALPGDEAGSPDPGVVQPRVDGQRDAAGHRRQGGFARASGRSPCAATAASRC